MSLFLQGKKIVKKVNYIPVKSSRLYCLVFTIFLLKSQPLHSTKASKSASNDIKSLNQAAIKINSCLFCSKMRANKCFFYSVCPRCNCFSVCFDNDQKKLPFCYKHAIAMSFREIEEKYHKHFSVFGTYDETLALVVDKI